MRAVSSSRLARDGGSTSTRAKPREWTATIRPWCRRGCRLHSTTVRQGTCRACGCRRFRFTRRRHRPAARRRRSYRATGRLRLPSNRSFRGGAACRRLGSDPGRPRMHTGVVRIPRPPRGARSRGRRRRRAVHSGHRLRARGCRAPQPRVRSRLRCATRSRRCLGR